MPFAPAGTGPAGYDPIPSPGEANVGRRARARKIDGATGDFVLDDAGVWVPCDPIEQGVALSLCIRRGTIKSAPLVGHTLDRIRVINPQTIAADIRDRVRDAYPLRLYLAAGTVALDKIDHVLLAAGGFTVAAYYRNLRVDPNRRIPVEARV